ncbi:TRADD-N-associated membrane domain-containing protein [Bacillus velezensis]|uniref:TRADD-N-associated membrane domain-containing protein n=1 Tax=Bacillus amyloliquefaciens group TaxID=1938374 RepID=UPI0004587F98|nr:hypothetical protein [Bacillus velezensis]AIW38696.1 hypothetical protein KS07_14920 [Bacillus subtilis]AHZ17241.1 hypothetical protein V529_32150 [Bacillus velezensis SQR9]AKF75438.1 hypothetical protein AAV30_04235 [Bacillus velezensis]AWD14601.1 hypothetical protein B9C53_14465 [Bacillus velezensis]MDH2302866.1 hypothetical protein [Bacillus velezensis]
MGNSFSPRESESEIISSNRQSDLKYLEREKTLLELKAKKRKAVFFICGMFYAIFGLVFFSVTTRSELNLMVSLSCFLIGITLSVLAHVMPDQRLTTMIYDIEREIDLLQSDDSLKNRSETLFKQHDLQLKRYYDLNLRQNSFVFWVGISCIVLGFVFIGITLYLISGNILGNPQNKIIVAATGALAGILSNFIAAIYLKMHTNSINSLTEFHNRIVNTHHFYFSNFLISQIKDEQKREETLANLALNISNEDKLQEQSPE